MIYVLMYKADIMVIISLLGPLIVSKGSNRNTFTFHKIIFPNPSFIVIMSLLVLLIVSNEGKRNKIKFRTSFFYPYLSDCVYKN